MSQPGREEEEDGRFERDVEGDVGRDGRGCDCGRCIVMATGEVLTGRHAFERQSWLRDQSAPADKATP